MESGAISDGQISSSSEFDSNHGPTKARLHKVLGAGSWVAASKNLDQWLMIDLLIDDTKVTGVATQGRSSDNHWVTKYKLAYRSNGNPPTQYYRDEGQSVDKVLTLYRCHFGSKLPILGSIKYIY